MNLFSILVLLVHLLCLQVHSQEIKLKANHVEAKLTTPVFEISAVYDRGFNIYIFGNWGHVLQYNINTGNITAIGKSPWSTCHILDFDIDGNIICFFKGSEDVYKFDTKSYAFSNVSRLPPDAKKGFTVKYNESSLLILGGYEYVLSCNAVVHFDVNTLVSKVLPDLPNLHSLCGFFTTIIVKDEEAMLLRLESSYGLKFNLETFVFSTISFGKMSFDNYYPSIVTDGDFAYLIGCIQEAALGYGKGYAIFQYNIETHNVSYIPIDNIYPGTETLSPPASVYVPLQNRIYFFGGTSNRSTVITNNEIIWYIDLQPLNNKPGFTSNIPEEWEESSILIWILSSLAALALFIITVAGLLVRCRHLRIHLNSDRESTVPVRSQKQEEGVISFSAKLAKQKCESVWKSPQSLVLVSSEPIGRGSFASVYKAKHSLLPNLNFVVKKISLYNALKHSQWDLAKVLREVESLAEIVNPNVVKMFNCWLEEPNGTILKEDAIETFQFHEWSLTKDYSVFVQMEFCDSTLKQWLIIHDSLEKRIDQDIKNLFRQIVNGLRGVHEKNIIHRDIKPSNIFHLHEGNLWKIGDLGLSTKFTDSTNEKSIVGCASYRSPEMDSASDYNTQTDVFSLGLSLLEIIHLFKSEYDKTRTFSAIKNSEQNTVRYLNDVLEIDSCVTQDLVEVVDKMLQIDPKKRWDIFNPSIDALLS